MRLSSMVLGLAALARAVPVEETPFPLAGRDLAVGHPDREAPWARSPAPVPAAKPADPVAAAKAPDLGAGTEPVKPEVQDHSPEAEPAQPDAVQHGPPKLGAAEPAGVKSDSNNAEATNPEMAKYGPRMVTLAELRKLAVEENPPDSTHEESCSIKNAKREEHQEWKNNVLLSKRAAPAFTLMQWMDILRYVEKLMPAPIGVLALEKFSGMSLGADPFLGTQDAPTMKLKEITLMFRSTATAKQILQFTAALMKTAQQHPLLAGKVDKFPARILQPQSVPQEVAASIERGSVDTIFTGPLGKLHIANAWYDYQVTATMRTVYDQRVANKGEFNTNTVEEARRFLGKAFQKNGIRMNMGHLEYLFRMTGTDGAHARDIILGSTPSIQRAALTYNSPSFENDVAAFVNTAHFGTPVPWGSC